MLTLIEFFCTLDDDQLMRVWCSFNSYEWPEVLEGFRPWWWNGWVAPQDPEVLRLRRHGFIQPFMDYIGSRVSEDQKTQAWKSHRKSLEVPC